ncbi:MAG: TonB-dependent receptor [Colwellia sp.]|nr:TonB-dependent receptor [Colwellia sp.]
MKHVNLKKSLLNVAILSALLPYSSYAVEEQETEDKKIEVIMVTAQKRVQSINDIGVSMTAFGDDDLKDLGITQPLDLAAQTSNLNINNTFQNSIPNVSIRGLGLNDYAVNNNPATGLYVDEVYLSSPAMLSFQLFDVERVEVLKGPQGTLYGRNTTAGTVTFVSKKPTEDTEGYLSLDYGTFERTSVEGAVSGELAEGLTGRIAGKMIKQNEGHQYNRYTNKKVGEIDTSSFRAMLNWKPSDTVDVLFNIHTGTDKSDTWLLKVDNTFIDTDDGYFSGDPFSSAGNDDTRMNVESEGAALTVNWDISDKLTFTSVTGYEQYERHVLEDRDGSGLVQLDAEYKNEIDQKSQEFRLTYVSNDWVLIGGAFYGVDQIETRDRFDAPDLPFPFKSVGNEYKQEAKAAGVYIHSEYNLNKEYKLTTGVRYTDETKVFFDAFTFIYGDEIPANGGTQFNIFEPVKNDYDVTDLSGKIGLDYSGIEDTLLYTSISKGFKSGNFQGQITFTPSDLAAFKEEEVIAYEVGFKSTLLDNTLQLNGAAFFYDYTDMQMYGPLYFLEGVGPLFGIDNVGDAELKGMELDATWYAFEGLDIKLGLGLLDTEVTNSFVVGVAQGSELPNSPEVNFNSNIRYSWEFGDSLEASIIFNSSYKGDVSYDIVNQPKEAVEDGYWLHNVRIGLTSLNDNWGVYLYGNNLADKEYRTQVLTSTVGFGETYGMPRTFGISVDYSW